MCVANLKKTQTDAIVHQEWYKYLGDFRVEYAAVLQTV